MSTETTKIIYSMIGVTKEVNRRVILKDTHLGYYYGAKIGVLGLNGAGKSTLLRILADVDTRATKNTLSPRRSLSRSPKWA